MEGFAGKVAVVTGAGSGIGQALAVELARSGAKVAISDVNPEGLAITAERLRAIGADVKADRLDVSDGAAFAAYAESVNEHFGKGKPIWVSGILHARTYERNDGTTGMSLDVQVTQFDFVPFGSKPRKEDDPAEPTPPAAREAAEKKAEGEMDIPDITDPFADQ